MKNVLNKSVNSLNIRVPRWCIWVPEMSGYFLWQDLSPELFNKPSLHIKTAICYNRFHSFGCKSSFVDAFYDIFINFNSWNNVIELFSAQKKGSPILIIPPEPASSHDSNGLLFIKSALKFHFFISGFAHDFTFFCFSLAFFVIAFLLLPWARFLSAMPSPAVPRAVIYRIGKKCQHIYSLLSTSGCCLCQSSLCPGAE